MAGQWQETKSQPLSTLPKNNKKLLKQLSERTKVPIAVYIREGIELVLKKYRKELPGQQLPLVEEKEEEP